MKLVRLDEARSGQRVARDVKDVHGSLLFKAGTTLTPDLIQRLRGWKVTHVFLEDASGAAGGPADPPAAREEAVEQELDRLFSEARAHPVMARLRDAVARHLKGRPR